MIHLSAEEASCLRCQNVTSKRGGDRYGALAFTEQGVAMLSSVLKSEKAAEVNVEILRRIEDGCVVHSVNHPTDIECESVKISKANINCQCVLLVWQMSAS